VSPVSNLILEENSDANSSVDDEDSGANEGVDEEGRGVVGFSVETGKESVATSFEGDDVLLSPLEINVVVDEEADEDEAVANLAASVGALSFS